MHEFDALKARVCREVTSLATRLSQASRELHRHPELAFEEWRAGTTLTQLFAGSGFRIERGVGGLKTAFRAVSRTKHASPSIAFLAEYDALPGLGHACGHNLIGPAACGAALAVARLRLPGRVLVIGCPAEERGGGKVLLARAGVFQGVEAAMMVHPGNRTEVVKQALAMIPVEVEFFGKASHAAASPERGINALDALLLMFAGINALRQHLPGDARVHGIITHGGQAPNIIPDYTAARLLVRALDRAYARELLEKVRGCAEGAAAATGARVKVTVGEPAYEPFHPNLVLAELFRANLERLGIKAKQGKTDEAIGSSDIGNVSLEVPTIHPQLAIAGRTVAIHTPEFARIAGSERGIQGMLTAAKALAMTGVDLLADPAALKRVKGAHRPPPAPPQAEGQRKR